MPNVIDVLFIFVIVVFVIGFIDLLLYLLLWRINVLDRNINRRMKQKEKKRSEALWEVTDPRERLRLQKEREALQSAKDDSIFGEADRFYGAPW